MPRQARPTAGPRVRKPSAKAVQTAEDERAAAAALTLQQNKRAERDAKKEERKREKDMKRLEAECRAAAEEMVEAEMELEREEALEAKLAKRAQKKALALHKQVNDPLAGYNRVELLWVFDQEHGPVQEALEKRRKQRIWGLYAYGSTLAQLLSTAPPPAQVVRDASTTAEELKPILVKSHAAWTVIDLANPECVHDLNIILQGLRSSLEQ